MAAAAKGDTAPHVFKAITEVMTGLVELGGISKDRRNADQGYNFRGIDDVYNVLSKLLSAHNLMILPEVVSRKVYKRATRNNAIMYNVVLQVHHHFVSSIDGSQYTVTTFGEASDMADKATNKAMSAAYKYAVIQAFCIPVEVEDADETTPPETVDPKAVQQPPQQRKGSSQPPAQKQQAKGSNSAAGSGMLSAERVAEITASIASCKSEAAICAIAKKFVATAAPKEGLPKVSKETAVQLAKSIAAKRAGLSTVDSYNDYELMVQTFVANGWLGNNEAEIYLSNAREN